MTEGKMTEQDRASLQQWHNTEAAIDALMESAPMQAMFRAEQLQLDVLAHALAGEAAAAAEDGVIESQFWATPNAALADTLRKMHTAPAEQPGQLAAAADTLKAHGLWPWD